MTVTYTSEVATNSVVGSFVKLLARWRGSIYKLVWMDLLLFLGAYYALNLTYLFVLDDNSKLYFQKIVRYCQKYGTLIPLSFVLGFYVNVVMTRWWSQYSTIPFPDNLAILVGASIKGEDDKSRIIRRTIVRYVCVTFTITLTMMSPKVKRRFPTLDHFIKAGLITEDEKKIMESLENEYPGYSKYWLPLAWASNIVTRSRHEGLIRDDESVKYLLEELNLFRSKCGGMLDFDWISIPLVYTQVVTLAVYTYFLTAIFGQQFIADMAEKDQTDAGIFYFPILPVLEFFFYMGWLKVAETLINPFGEDDDDFEVNWMIDRHIQVCYLLVDKIHHEHPKLMKDSYWAQKAPNCLPYTLTTLNYSQECPIPSTDKIKINKSDDIIMPDPSEVDAARNNRRGSSSVWNYFRKRERGHSPLNLENIRTEKNGPANLELPEDVNDYLESGPGSIHVPKPKKSYNPLLNEDFEKLKHARLEIRRQKLLSYVNLMHDGGKYEKEKIIKDIIK